MGHNVKMIKNTTKQLNSSTRQFEADCSHLWKQTQTENTQYEIQESGIEDEKHESLDVCQLGASIIYIYIKKKSNNLPSFIVWCLWTSSVASSKLEQRQETDFLHADLTPSVHAEPAACTAPPSPGRERLDDFVLERHYLVYFVQNARGDGFSDLSKCVSSKASSLPHVWFQLNCFSEQPRWKIKGYYLPH